MNSTRVIKAKLSTNTHIKANLGQSDNILMSFTDRKISNTDYPPLANKPKINSITLIGDKSSEELKLQSKMQELSVQEIEKMLYLD